MINHDEALKILEELVPVPNIHKHLLATEAIMRVLAQKFEPEKEEEWAMAGLLHDGDYNEYTPHEKQGIEISNILEKRGFPLTDEVKHAMAAHNVENTGVQPESKMDWSLFCCDSLTGLIVATALVRPDKKLASVELGSILKKFNNPSFAAGTRREDIISLSAMQKISPDLGL
ncbi:MAG: HD domain-containing protein [bacterium]|nr:HD domain-containing protein [bacterium]